MAEREQREREVPPPGASTGARWSTVAELVSTLRKRWDRGHYLRRYAGGQPFEPVHLKVNAPGAKEILTDLDAAQRWARTFDQDAARHGGAVRIERRTVKGSGLGANQVPSHLAVGSFGDLCVLLGTAGDVSRLDEVLWYTAEHLPALSQWVRAHPLVAIEHAGQWRQLVAVVDWIATHDTSQYYLREIDLEGVDTKFVERHRRILGSLLAEVLPPLAVRSPEDGLSSQFDRRHGFRTKPRLVRLRPLDPAVDLWGLSGAAEVGLRTDDLAARGPATERVFVVENEVSYLAFPEVADSLVVFGEGRAAATLERIGWFGCCELVYWGDIDTHGFVILDRLRSAFPNVRSMLMDRATLLAHRDRWVTEGVQAPGPLQNLEDDEAALFEELLAGTHGEHVRLEQERIGFAMVRDHLAALGNRP